MCDSKQTYPRWSNALEESSNNSASSLDVNSNSPITFKAFNGSEIRRFSLEPSVLSWSYLEQEISSLFKLPLHSFAVKYQDSEDDMISISTDKELQMFISSFPKASILKLNIDILPVPKQEAIIHQPSSPMMTFSPTWSNPNNQSGFFASSSPALRSTSASPISGGFNDEQGRWGNSPVRSNSISGFSGKKEAKKMEKEKRKREKEEKKSQRQFMKKDEKEAWKCQRKEDKLAKKHAKKRQKSGENQSSSSEEESKMVLSPNSGASNLDRKQLKKQQKFEKRFEKKLEKKMKKGAKSKPLFARFVKHVTIPDNEDVAPGARLLKTWRLRNDGTAPWPADTALIYLSQRAGGAQMCSPSIVYLREYVEPGKMIDVSVQLIAPDSSGFYSGFWRLCGTDKDGKMRKFGQQVWCKIHVLSLSDSERQSTGDRRPQHSQHIIVEDASPMNTDQNSDALMQRLMEMGFKDPQANMDALRKNNGDLYRTINYLSAASNNNALF